MLTFLLRMTRARSTKSLAKSARKLTFESPATLSLAFGVILSDFFRILTIFLFRLNVVNDKIVQYAFYSLLYKVASPQLLSHSPGPPGLSGCSTKPGSVFYRAFICRMNSMNF